MPVRSWITGPRMSWSYAAKICLASHGTLPLIVPSILFHGSSVALVDGGLLRSPLHYFTGDALYSLHIIAHYDITVWIFTLLGVQTEWVPWCLGVRTCHTTTRQYIVIENGHWPVSAGAHCRSFRPCNLNLVTAYCSNEAQGNILTNGCLKVNCITHVWA